jgi:TRAP-type C4-dicarboxylate transport system substrate-binding protein
MTHVSTTRNLTMNVTRVSVVVLISLVVATIAGCGKQDSPASADVRVLKLATDSGAKGSPSGNAMDRWAELIETGTNSELDVRVFYQNELGGQQEIFDLFIANEVNLTLNWPMTSYDPRIAVIYTPYMFTSWDDALDAYRPGGWVNGMLTEIYADLGLKFFGAWPEGFNGVATKGKYVTSVSAASEMKITLRAPPIFPFPEIVQAMGYQTATIDWGEVYPAIQMGVVDGDAANVVYWDYEFFRDVIEYYTHTRQQFNTGILAINQTAWDSLAPEHQEVVQDAAITVMEEGFSNAQAIDKAYVEKARAAGITYVELSEGEMKAMAEVVRDKIWPMMEERIGKPTMDTVRANARDL